MAAEYVVAIDIGTQSTRAALVDARGQIADVASAPIDLFAPQPGWAEQDPEQWWQTTVASLAAIMTRHPAARVAAVAVGAQMHSLVAVDAAGQPLTARAAIWSDKRCLDQVREFSQRADCGPLSRVAGNRPLPAWAGFKMAWLRENAPDAYARAASLLVAKDFVNLRLCGTAATDPSEASGTFLCDAGTGQWSPPLLEALGISRARLPDIAASSAVIGTIRPAVARLTGLTAGVPVVAGSGDMMCQLLGAGITVPGRVGLVAGTASIVAAAAGAASPDPRVMNLRSASGSWIHFGISDAAGKSFRWFADQLAGPPGGAAFEELTRQAAQVRAGSDGLLFFPYLLGERTLGSPLSRGSFIGATLGHGRAHFARAVLEGITFEDRRALEAICPPAATGPDGMAGATGPAGAAGPAAVRCCGGGARSALWNQIRAGIFGRPVQTLDCAEGGILGAALLAGVGAGWYPDAAAGADQVIRAACTWEPDPAEAAVYQSAFRDFCAAHDALQELWPRWAGGDRSNEGAGSCHDRALRCQVTLCGPGGCSMRERPLGKTGLSVSEIGYGAWGIGGSSWIGAREDESVRALHRAIELGVNFIDTARGYGESERIVGRVVRDHPGETLYVATKVPPRNRIWPAPSGVDPAEAFPGDHIRASLETSLRASGLEAFDVLQFHVWSDEWLDRGDWLATVEDLKKEGKIRFFGVSVNDYQTDNVIGLVNSGHVDTIQAIYNVFHQAPEERLLPACADNGVGVIVRVPLDEGALTGQIDAGTTFPDGDFRNNYFRGDRKAEVGRRIDALTADLGIGKDQVAEVALRYVLGHPAVSTIAVGMRSIRNVERNAALSDGQDLPAGQRAALARHRWEKNFYQA